MNKIVFLNIEKLNFDENLDFSALTETLSITKYAHSSEKEILERVEGHNVVITKELPVGRELIEKFPPCVKLICEAGTGYNNIDVAAAREKGIAVCNVPGYSAAAVAQLTIALMLNLASSLSLQQVMVKQKNFDNFTRHLQVPHFEVKDKTFGVIGAGAIAQKVMKIALALEMKVLVYNRSVKDLGADIKFVSLEELLQNSDFVSINCPLAPNTKHLINIDKLKLMKKSSYLINAGRGSIVNEADLITALKEGIIAGAGLDVQEVEPPSLDNPLFYMDNVILTPHIGWQCLESRQRLIGIITSNIKSYFEGKAVNIVN